MATLADTLKQQSVAEFKATPYKNVVEIKAETEIGSHWLASKGFLHTKVPVNKLSLPVGDVGAASNVVVIDVNKNRVGRMRNGFVPKTAILCGSDLVREAKSKDIPFVECWVGEHALKALGLKNEIAAFAPSLAVGGFSNNAGMPAPSSATPDFFVNYGPAGSELNNPSFASMLNIEEALKIYLGSLKDGSWKPVSSQWAVIPPTLVDATNEASIIAKEHGLQAFAPMDFIKWQMAMFAAEVKAKTVGGKKLTADKFAYVGDPDDVSSWHLPTHDAKHVQLAFDMVSRTKGIPASAKPGVIAKIHKAAAKHGVSLATKKTSKQKAWEKK